MKLLLDTNVALAIGNSTESSQVAKLVRDPDNQCFLSVVALWEIAIKTSINKMDLGMSLVEFADGFASHGYSFLDVQPKHIYALGTLPSIHKDPFDRLLVAQAQREDMVLLTTDALLSGYGPNIKQVAKTG